MVIAGYFPYRGRQTRIIIAHTKSVSAILVAVKGEILAVLYLLIQIWFSRVQRY